MIVTGDMGVSFFLSCFGDGGWMGYDMEDILMVEDSFLLEGRTGGRMGKSGFDGILPSF